MTFYNNRYAKNNDKRLVIVAPIGPFSNYKLTTSSGKHLEEISHAHIVSLMYKLKTSAKGCDDMSIGFHRDRGVKQHELANNKFIKGIHLVRIYLKNFFGFSEQMEKATYNL